MNSCNSVKCGVYDFIDGKDISSWNNGCFHRAKIIRVDEQANLNRFK